MSAKDLITVCISCIALVISTYGILERGLATRRALRIRLTEIIDDLAQIDGDERVYVQDSSKSDSMKRALSQSNATRRALLAAQAVDLLARYSRRVTIPEYDILATALRGTSDTASERSVRAQAVASLKGETPFQQSAAWRGWAATNFEQGDFQTARRAMRRSIALQSPVDDIGRMEKVENLLWWLELEFQAKTEPTSLRPLLDQAEALIGTVDRDEVRRDATKRFGQVTGRVMAGDNTDATI